MEENQTHEVENPPTPEYVASLSAEVSKWRDAFQSANDRADRLSTLMATRINRVEAEILEQWNDLDDDGKEFAKTIARHLDITLSKTAKVEATVTFEMTVSIPIDTEFDDIDFNDFDFSVSESNFEFSIDDYDVQTMNGDMSVEQQ